MKKTRFILGVALIIFCAVAVSAWDWTTPFRRPSRDIRTLVMVGNYTRHRILAELIQQETMQPILLLPAVPGGKIFFMPPRKQALEIEDARFTDFVKFSKPERILIIGDGGPVTQSYIDRIAPYQTKIIVHNKNMEQTAIEVGKILDITDLADDFARLNRDLESGRLYRPGGEIASPEHALPHPPFQVQETVIEPAAATALPPALPPLVDENEVIPK